MNQLIYSILFASLAGLCLGINRSLLGRLGLRVGASAASAINHVGGAVFLFPVVFGFISPPVHAVLGRLITIPWYAYMGGIIGAVFTMFTSFLIPRLGVMKATVLFISGQVVCSAFFDYLTHRLCSPLRAVIGVILIITGVVLSEYHKAKETFSMSPS